MDNSTPKDAPTTEADKAGIKPVKSLKQRIDENLPLTVLGLLLAGFLAGVGAIRTIQKVTQPAPASMSPRKIPENLQKEIDQLLETHTKRIEVLQERLLECEREATSFANIESSQKTYADGAKRIAQDISEENSSFLEHLQAMRGIGLVQSPDRTAASEVSK